MSYKLGAGLWCISVTQGSLKRPFSLNTKYISVSDGENYFILHDLLCIVYAYIALTILLLVLLHEAFFLAEIVGLTALENYFILILIILT